MPAGREGELRAACSAAAAKRDASCWYPAGRDLWQLDRVLFSRRASSLLSSSTAAVPVMEPGHLHLAHTWEESCQPQPRGTQHSEQLQELCRKTLFFGQHYYFEFSCIMNTHKAHSKKYPSGYNKTEFNDTHR